MNIAFRFLEIMNGNGLRLGPPQLQVHTEANGWQDVPLVVMRVGEEMGLPPDPLSAIPIISTRGA